MGSKHYTEEFKIKAVKQVTGRGHPVAEVASRIGVSQHRLPAETRVEQQSQAAEIRCLKTELKRVTEERDILKGRGVLCQVMAEHPRGYQAQRAEPLSERDKRLLGLIKQSWLESGGVYGYRKITTDLRDLSERGGKNRVNRLMRTKGLRSQTGYRRRKDRYGKSVVVAQNRLEQQFDAQPQPGLGH